MTEDYCPECAAGIPFGTEPGTTDMHRAVITRIPRKRKAPDEVVTYITCRAWAAREARRLWPDSK